MAKRPMAVYDAGTLDKESARTHGLIGMSSGDMQRDTSGLDY